MKRQNFSGRKALKASQAIARQVEHEKLSKVEKIAKLDRLLGIGIGATKERGKLN
jgi:hypothetical protein